jgi:DNA primase large subunit
MFSILDWLKISAGVCVGIVMTSIYWLGVPLLNDYPVLKNIPLIGNLAVGHVETVKADALKGYVLLSEKTAAEARARELERQINAAAQSLEEHRKRTAAAEKAKEEENERLEKIVAEDGGDDGLRWNDADIEWLRQH